MSGNAFVSDQVLVDVSFTAATARLKRLAGDGVLLGAAECAYGEGITGLAQEARPAAGMCRLTAIHTGVALDGHGPDIVFGPDSGQLAELAAAGIGW